MANGGFANTIGLCQPTRDDAGQRMTGPGLSQKFAGGCIKGKKGAGGSGALDPEKAHAAARKASAEHGSWPGPPHTAASSESQVALWG